MKEDSGKRVGLLSKQWNDLPLSYLHQLLLTEKII